MTIELRPLGRTGIHVSRFGLGAMVLGAWGNTDLKACRRIIDKTLDAGINLIDTADMYADGQNEQIVGEAIAGRRDEVVLCTKFHYAVGDHDDPNRRGNSRRWIRQAVDDSLRRLGTDHIDVYQVHRPDPTTDLAETVAALDDLITAGKIVAWGTSTFPAEEIVLAHWAAERRGQAGPHTEQPPYSILARGIERDVLPVAERFGMGVVVWSPLSGGWLTGKYSRSTAPPANSRAATDPDHFDGGNEAKFDAVERLASIAADAGISLTHMSLAWCVEHPAVTAALIGPKTEQQLDDLLGAAELRLDADTLDAIDAVVAPGTDINPDDAGWTPPGLDPQRRRRSS
jgi:aryl-alcohol dehydrogenase-like predicted oxidoreductase